MINAIKFTAPMSHWTFTSNLNTTEETRPIVKNLPYFFIYFRNKSVSPKKEDNPDPKWGLTYHLAIWKNSDKATLTENKMVTMMIIPNKKKFKIPITITSQTKKDLWKMMMNNDKPIWRNEMWNFLLYFLNFFCILSFMNL